MNRNMFLKSSQGLIEPKRPHPLGWRGAWFMPSHMGIPNPYKPWWMLPLDHPWRDRWRALGHPLADVIARTSVDGYALPATA